MNKEEKIKINNSLKIFYEISLVADHWGGIVGGFKFTFTFGACRREGNGPEGGTKLGCSGGFMFGGCVGTFPGLAIDVAFPGFTAVSTSVRLWV